MYDYKLSPLTGDWVVTRSDRVAVERGCYFDIESAKYVLDFFIQFIKQVDGPNAGEPFYPLPWQWERIIAPAFGWKMPDGLRRFKEVEVWIPKKNGKTTLSAGLLLYTMLADGEIGANVYSAAADRAQAAIIFEQSKKMVKSSEHLAAVLDVKKSQRRIDCPALDSRYEVLSADAFRNEGHNIHALFFDELHTQKNRLLWAALRYGSAARKQGIRFVISTVGSMDETSLWWERFSAAKAVQEGRKVDIHLLPCVYAMNQDEDWRDPEVWKRVNPSWGDTINTLEFTRDFENSLTNAANEGEFKRYRLNMPTRTVTPWIQYNYWDKCLKSSEKWLGKRPERHRKIYLGVDLAESIDLVASVAIWEETDESLPEETGQTVVCVEASFFAPAEAGITANQGNRERYEQWWEGGHMVQLPGNVVPIGAVEMAIVNDYRNHDVKKVGVDKYNAMRFKNRMDQLISEFDLGWEIELQSYNGMSMNEPTRFLAELIVGNKLRLVNPEVLTWMFGNLRAAIDSSGNMKLDKKNSLNKIDGFAALCMALAAFVNDDPEFHSRYENNKVSTIDVIL